MRSDIKSKEPKLATCFRLRTVLFVSCNCLKLYFLRGVQTFLWEFDWQRSALASYLFLEVSLGGVPKAGNGLRRENILRGPIQRSNYPKALLGLELWNSSAPPSVI